MRWLALGLAAALAGCSAGTGVGDDTSGADAAADGAAADGGSNAEAAVADAGGADAGSDAAARPPVCLGAQAGAYCGGDMVQDGDPDTLYECPGKNQAPTKATPCTGGCQVSPPGTPDACKVSGDYKLPWPNGTSMQLTQDCNDSCCNDHVGNDAYAWDFADGKGFQVVAARGGTITHLKINSTTGCGSSSCANDVNFIVIDHGDGTQSTYLHLAGMSLAQNVACGAQVTQGQPLATAGTTGWSTGVHLHYQVSGVHSGAPTCECGANGLGCGATTVPWASFWVSSTYPSLPIQFVEWPAASTCGDRRITMPASQN